MAVRARARVPAGYRARHVHRGAHPRVVTLYPSRLLDVDVRTFPDPGKDYARAHEKVPLRELLNEAMTPLTEYSKWLRTRMDEHHADDFARLDLLLAARAEAKHRVDKQPVDDVVEASLEGITLSTRHLTCRDTPEAGHPVMRGETSTMPSSAVPACLETDARGWSLPGCVACWSGSSR